MANTGAKRAGWVVVVGGIAAALLLWWHGGSPPAAPALKADAGAAPAEMPLAPAHPLEASPAARALREVAPKVPVRVELPSVAAEAYDGGRRAVLDLAPGVKLPTDRRENPGPRAKAQLEILGYAFQTLREDVDDCLRQWQAMDAGATGEVMLVFQLDHDGLQKTWLEGAGQVPFGPKSCIANAVYGLDWSGVADEPVQVSQRFELDADGGE